MGPGGQVTITPDAPPQQSAAPVTITPDEPGFLDKDIPLDSYTHATESGLQSIGRGVRGALYGGWNALKTAGQAWNDPKADVGDAILPDPHLEQVPGAIKDINASPDPAGTYAKVGQETAGQGAGAALIALATEGAGRLPAGRMAKTAGSVVKGVAEDIPVVRQAGKLRQYWDASAPKPTYPGAPEPATPPTEVTQAASLSRGPQPVQDPAGSLATIPAKAEPVPTYPGASEPAVPDPALLKAQNLLYGPKPVEDPAAGLGQIPVRRGSLAGQMQESVQAPPIKRGSISQMMNEIQSKVGEGLGAAPPPNPKAPIYQRGSLADSMKQASPEGTPDVPQGHTPHQSSALRSSMYDSGANEFHARMTSGDTTYVYGDVRPEEAQAFADAESKGKAYQQMKSGHPLVAKIVNGKRVAVKPVGQ